MLLVVSVSLSIDADGNCNASSVHIAYFEGIGSVVATQAATTKHSQHSPLVTRTCPSTRPWLLYHIQPTSILITQLRSEGEAFLLRERVLSNAIAEEDELIHRRRRRENATVGDCIYNGRRLRESRLSNFSGSSSWQGPTFMCCREEQEANI